MNEVSRAIYTIHSLDTIALRDKWVNHIHPLIKLLLTSIYIVIVVSFSKYDVIGILGMVAYLIVLFVMADLSFPECLYRLRIVLPIVALVGIANLLLDRTPVMVGGIIITTGLLSMISVMLKGVFAVLAAYILIATTTIEQICYALRILHMPDILVTQILLTYRYISVLLKEVNRTTQAYQLRAPKQKGIHIHAWGSLVGQILLRSIDRADEVYESMTLRGYNGEFKYLHHYFRMGGKDILYFLLWLAFFVFARRIPYILWFGNIFGGFIG